MHYDYECKLKRRQYNRAKTKLKDSETNANIIAERKACIEYQNAIHKFRQLQNNRFQSKLWNLRVTDTYTYWKRINDKPTFKAKPRILELK